MPVQKKSDMPSTIQRSSKKAQEVFRKTINSAHEQYGSGRREYQTAYKALRQAGFEKKGDKWVQAK